jgi:uncharacterized protein YjbJ (UPF0337 family)
MMSLTDKAKTAAKDLAGNVEETIGKITGNDETKNAGRAKQAQADHDHDAEELKDKAKKLAT